MITKVAEGIYRGPRVDWYHDLRALGIRTILNLEDSISARQVELDAIGDEFKLNLDHPMSEIWPPSSQELRDCVAFISKKENQPVYIHCKHGQDRTGYVVAYRIIKQRWSFKAAYMEARAMGHKWWFAPYLLLWPKVLKKIEREEIG